VLQELVDEGVTEEVLPTLQNMFLNTIPPSSLVKEGIMEFDARELSGHPKAISPWPTGLVN